MTPERKTAAGARRHPAPFSWKVVSIDQRDVRRARDAMDGSSGDTSGCAVTPQPPRPPKPPIGQRARR